MLEGYEFDAREVLRLFLARHFPERTDHESAILRDYLTGHVGEYERVMFSVRVGKGWTPNPDDLPGIQRTAAFSSRKRIDFLGWQGNQPTIGEVKQRIAPGVLGQLLTYRQLLLDERPDVDEPRLIAIGRYADDDTIRVLRAEAVTVYLYAETASS